MAVMVVDMEEEVVIRNGWERKNKGVGEGREEQLSKIAGRDW